jgi:3-hydroxyisobutyrate dehydrogenase
MNKPAARLVTLAATNLRFFSAAAKAPIGFIGLGNMGGHMANNLLRKGHDLVVLDVVPASIENVKAFAATVGRTVTVASSPAEVAAAADTVVTMLPSSPHVKEVYAGAKGLFSALPGRKAAGKPQLLLIDSSTIAPPVAVEVAAQAAAQADGAAVMVDAPVSGGVGGAEQGTLTFMVGGPDATFAAAKSVLELMGKNIVHCGAAGTGQAAKVCNNLILGISMAGVSEAFNLAGTLGLDAKVLAGIVNTSSGRCWSSDTYNPVPGVMPAVPASKGYVVRRHTCFFFFPVLL